MKKYIAITGISLIFCGLSMRSNAQQLILNKGEEYKVTTVLTAAKALKRGDQQIDLTANSTLVKSYKVTDASDNGYTLAITATNIVDTLNAFNQKTGYDTNNAADPASSIETALKKMIGETQTVSFDKSGKITQVVDMDKATRDADAAAIAGVHHDNLAVGFNTTLGADFKLPMGAKSGTKWTEENQVGDLKVKTMYKVEETNEIGTKISFKSEQSEPGINTNTNGLLVMENATGIILQRVLKSNQVSNQSVDGKNFISSSNKVLSEVVQKVN